MYRGYAPVVHYVYVYDVPPPQYYVNRVPRRSVVACS